MIQRKYSFSNIIIGGGLLLALAGCQSAPKAELTSNTPEAAILEVTQEKNNAQQVQADLLAHKEYKKGASHLADAREELDNGEKVESILEKASIAKAYFQKSREIAASKKDVSEPILKARKAVTTAGVRNSKNLSENLEDIDETFRDETDNFTTSLDLEEFSKIQKSYLDLEVDAIEYAELNGVRSIIEMAKSEDAEDRAPQTLSQAKLDERAATNLIAQNTHSPELYAASVAKANKSANLLNAVMQKIKTMGPETTEKVALNLVENDRKIGRLNENLEAVEANLDQSQATTESLMGAVAEQGAELMSASEKVSFQQEMERARAKLPQDKVDAYQQGDKLVIRLKKINFPVGSDAIPSDSISLLEDVRSVIKNLNPEKVVVEGHTDSTGSNGINQKLSTERAKAVASYIQSTEKDVEVDSVGYGELKPIATNDTKQGRASNRRVDIVISVKK